MPPPWPNSFATQPGGPGTTVQAALLDQNFSAAVFGAAASTDSAIALFDGTTGKIVKDSGIKIGTAAGNVPQLGPGGTLDPALLNLGQLTDSLLSDVTMTSTASYFDGPTVAQGAVGVWFASGSVTIFNPTTADFFDFKLWDGTTVLASGRQFLAGGTTGVVALSGFLATPAGNLRISVKPDGVTNALITANGSGNSKDATLSAFRLA